MSDTKVVDVILHCQKQIKKERLTEDKLLHYLGRLSRLRITVQDLADTGIGRTVNSLSRNEGQVGQAAERLVRGWKRMVSDQQNQVEQESEEESDSNSGSSEEEEDMQKNDDEPYDIVESGPTEEIQSHPYGNGHSSNDEARENVSYPSDGNTGYDEADEDDNDIDDIDDPYMDNGFMNLANVHTDEEDEEDDENDGNESDLSDRLQIADVSEQSHRRTDIKEEHIIKQEKEDYYHDEDQSYSSYQQEKFNSPKQHEDDDRRESPLSKTHHERSSSSSKGHSSSSSSKDSRKEHRHHSSKSSSGDAKERSSKHEDQQHHHDHKGHRHHSSSKSRESKSEHQKSHGEKDKHRSKDHGEKHKSVKSEKERKSQSDREKKDSVHQSSSSSSSSKDKPRETGSSSHSSKKSSPESNKIDSSDKRKRKEHHLEASSSSSSKKSKIVVKEEIDSTSGINFADALGCLDTSPTKHRKIKKEDSEKLHGKSDSHRSSSSHHKSDSSRKHESSSSKHSKEKASCSSSSSRHSEKEYDKTSKRLAQIKVESVIQPVVNISPNYKPSSSSLATLQRPTNTPNGLNSVPPPPISISQADLLTDLGPDYMENVRGPSSETSQEDAISTMLSSRNARSKVYSGVKTARNGVVPALFDLCMQVIKDNIGDLGYTGGIPYDILKPALERANPVQLMSIEGQNDYLIGETDELWQFHCKRDFRGKCPDETESWRELYERCKEEQQMKFEQVKKMMKRSIASAEPVRKAKLAYVDTSCGPRFNLQKAQTIKNGMKTLKIKEEKGPGRGVSSSASAGFNNPKKSGDAHNVKVEEASVIIGAESRSGHAPAPSVSRAESAAAKFKPKKAPLMQKTMKLIRSLNRR